MNTKLPTVGAAAWPRFQAKFCPEPSGCWVWSGAKDRWGYGQFGSNRRVVLAHRWSYEYFVGPIEKGLTLDHLCRNRGCVNPAHLQVVTMRENILRGECPPANHARKTHCKYGHPLSGKNLAVWSNGVRVCRTCRRRLDAQWRAKNGNVRRST